MERRNFLRGVLAGVTAGGLVIAATPAEVDAFASIVAPGAPVALDPVPPPDVVLLGVRLGDHLYNASGELVALVTKMHYRVPPVEVTMAWDNTHVYVPGRLTVTLEAEGVGRPLMR